MIYLYAFVFGGAICALGEIIKLVFKITNGHITGLFVCIGALLEFFNIYDSIVDLVGAGALLPITSFGHSLAHAAFVGAKDSGIIGLFSNVYDKTSGGISFTILLSTLTLPSFTLCITNLII